MRILAALMCVKWVPVLASWRIDEDDPESLRVFETRAPAPTRGIPERGIPKDRVVS